MCDKCLCRQLLWLLAPSLGQFVTRRSLGLKDVRTGTVLRVSFQEDGTCLHSQQQKGRCPCFLLQIIWNNCF